jgi:uncharacterized lipoprotein YmbA
MIRLVACSIGVAILVSLSGCSAPTAPTRFYMLAPLSDALVQESASARARPLVLSVGPIAVPEYLKRPQIVTRSGDTQMTLGDFDQWVEPFDLLFPRVLALDLAAVLGTDRVSLTPVARGVRPDNLVEVDVIRFDAAGDGTVTLDAQWRVYGRDGDRLLEQGRALLRGAAKAEADDEPDDGVDYPEVVRAMSATTADLARTIADAIGKTRQRR